MFMNLQEILKEIRHVDNDYHIFEDKDRIAIGLSGGKDSMVLLESLYQLSRFKDFNFEIVAIHIDLGFSKMDFSKINEYCLSRNIEVHHEPSQVYEILKHYEKNGKLSCSRCSKYKKACIVQAALKYNCNKIAFAHHADDAIETLFMNMIHGGRIATFEPKMNLDKSGLIFIRPLIYTFESEIQKITNQLNLPVTKNTCPNDKHTERQRIKEMLNQMYLDTPQAKNNFLKMISNTKQINLWVKENVED